MAGLVRPGGAVVVIVPAFPFAMSRSTSRPGTCAATPWQSLERVLSDSGLRVEQVLDHANALGLLGYYMATSVLHLSPKEGRMVKVYDSVVLPTTKAVERVVRPPFGQSVFAVARRPA